MQYDYFQRQKLIADMIKDADWQGTLEILQKINEEVWANKTKEELLVKVVLLANEMLIKDASEIATGGLRIYFEEDILFFNITISPKYII